MTAARAIALAHHRDPRFGPLSTEVVNALLAEVDRLDQLVAVMCRQLAGRAAVTADVQGGEPR